MALIPSHRHRPEDIALWQRLEVMDRLNYRLRKVKEKAEKAMKSMLAFMSIGPCFLSISWGKDSLTLAHLLWRLQNDCRVKIPMVYLRAQPTENPDSLLVRDEFLRRFAGMDYREHFANYAEITFETAWRDVERGVVGTARRMTGIRGAESVGRKVRLRRHGLASKNALAPIGWWKEEDVFAYLANHDLPIHPAYAMLGNGRWNRNRIRVDEMGYVEADGSFRPIRGERGGNFGRGEWEREYYNDVISELVNA